MGVSEWIGDFARRLAQLSEIAGLDNLNNIEVWLGGLFFPEAYITATRQAVAHRKRWSLETLHLQLDIERVNDPEAFIVDGKWSSFPLVRYPRELTYTFRSRSPRCSVVIRQTDLEQRRERPVEPITSSLGTGR